MKITEPTPEQCDKKARVGTVNERPAFACWYPSMGGYVSKAVVVVSERDPSGRPGCFEAYVWHDGEFPFEGGEPRILHHCDPRQFVEFGQWVDALTKGN